MADSPLGGGLEEGAGGCLHAVAGKLLVRRVGLGSDFGGAIAQRPGDARDGMGGGEGRQFCAVLRGQGAVGADQQIGAGGEQIDDDSEPVLRKAASEESVLRNGAISAEQRGVQHLTGRACR